MAKIITTFEQAQIGAATILDHNNNGIHFVGFDTETTINRNIDKDKVSTIQISYIYNSTPISYIFQIYKIWKDTSLISPLLIKIIQSKSIIKVGVDITTDMIRLFNSYNIIANGYIDIQSITTTLNIPFSSLNDLCTKYLTDYSAKDPLGHKGDWDGTLSNEQILYGSRDAYYSFLLYSKIMDIKFDNVKIKNDDDINILHTWIMSIMKTSTKNRPIDSIINQICNSYKPWANKYTKQDKMELANKLINKMAEDGLLNIIDGCIIANRPDIMTINIDEATLKIIKGMRYHSAHNFLSNSFKGITNYSKPEKDFWITNILHKYDMLLDWAN